MTASLKGLARVPTVGPAPGGRHLSSVLVIWVATIAFIAFLLGALAFSKAKLEQRVREQIITVTQLAADRAALTFDDADRLLLSVLDELDPTTFAKSNGIGLADRKALRATLARKQARSTGIVSLTLVGTDGTVIASSDGSGADQRFDWQQYFPSLNRGISNAPAISEAATDPTSGIRGIRMARRVNGAGGRIAGLVVAHLDLEKSLIGFCQSLAFNDNDLIALRNGKNGLLAGYPTNKDPFLGHPGESVIRNAIASGDISGANYLRSSVDGINRLVGYRKLARYPLYMTYGKDVEDLLAMWRFELAIVVLAALFALIVSAAVTAGIRRRTVLTAQLQTVRGHLVDSNNALRAALAASEMVAARDQLTGLWNRRTFDQRLQEAVAHLGRHDGVFSLLLLDLDHFKNINDQFGHVAGDEVLRGFADVLHGRLRQNDVDARWGGEEFVVLADGAHLEAAFLLAEHIREAVEQTAFERPAYVTVSIGVAEYQSGETGDDLLARADDALYEAKRSGRNRVVAASGLIHGERFFTGSAAPAPLFAEDFAE